MRGDSYLSVLDHHMLPFWDIRRCNHFMQDGDPAHRSRVVKKWLKDNHVPVLECPRNSPDLNAIENARNYMKNRVHEAHSTNIQTLKEVLMKLWVPIWMQIIFGGLQNPCQIYCIILSSISDIPIVDHAVNDIYNRTNCLLADFSFTDSKTLSRLFNTYCTNIYGSPLWKHFDRKCWNHFILPGEKVSEEFGIFLILHIMFYYHTFIIL